MMRSMCLFLLLIVLCFTNFITQCRGQNEAHLEDLLSDLMTYFQSKSIVIHSNKMNVFKSKTLQGKYILSVDDQSDNSTYTIQNMDLHFISYTKSTLKHLLHSSVRRERINKESWLIYFDTNTTIQEAVTELIDLSMDFDDDFIVGLNQTDKVVLWEIYRIGPMEAIQYNNIGHWNLFKGSLKMSSIHKWHRRKNLKGYHFKTTALVESPFMSKIELNPQTGKYIIEGSFVELLNLYAKTMNFTYTLEPPPDNSWGGLQDDGSWNGMMKLVQDEAVDIATTSLFQTRAREEAASFSLPLEYGFQSVFIKNPANVYNYTAYLEPLTYWSWLSIMIFLLVFPILLYVVSRWAKDSSQISMGQSLETVYIALILMGSPFDPSKPSIRFVFGSMLIAAALIFYHWEAMLVSYLSSRKTIMPFSTITDMYLNTDFRLALIPATSYEDDFKYSTDPIWNKIYEERLEPYLQEYSNYPDHLSDMIHFIRDDFSTALYESFAPISSTKEYEDCLIVATEGKYIKRAYAWAFQKHSPYLEIFNFYLQEFNEKGSWNAIKNKYGASPQVCPDLSGMPLDLSQTFTAFLVLIFGVASGFILMLIECCKFEMLESLLGVNDLQNSIDLTSAKKLSAQEMEKTIAYQSDVIVNLRRQLWYFKNKPNL